MRDDEQSSPPDLFEQARNATDQALDLADSTAQAMVNAFDEATRSFSHTATQAVDSYREAIDDVRSQLPSFDEVVAQAVRLPGTSVNRASYLASSVGRKHSQRIVQAAIETTPAKAGLTARQIDKIAKHSLGKDMRRTTALSMAAGIPGGAAAAATIPADLVQFYGHLIRSAQKLTYLYGWRDLIRIEGGDPDRATSAALIVLLGVMAGVEQADVLLARLARLRKAGADDTRLRTALVSGAFAPEIKQLSIALTKRMAHRLTGQVAGKAVPIVGMVISGTISFAGFGDMAGRLHKQLKLAGA